MGFGAAQQSDEHITSVQPTLQARCAHLQLLRSDSVTIHADMNVHAGMLSMCLTVLIQW